MATVVCFRKYTWVSLCKLHSRHRQICHRLMSDSAKLKPLGTFEDVHPQEKPYKPGQLFFHKYFNYRGIVVSSWPAHVSFKDRKKPEKSLSVPDEDTGQTETQMFYHVLMDMNDSEHMKHLTGAATFLHENKYLMSIEGTDLVFHEDILPYHSKDTNPIANDILHDIFTVRKSKTAVQYDISKAFSDQQKNSSHQRWLQAVNVYSTITHNIQITVAPFYIGSMETISTVKHYWRYSIRLHNRGQKAMQLRRKNWHILFENSIENVRGHGVVGLQPIVSPEEPVFQYCSHAHSELPRGQMWGHFVMEKENGTQVECNIPMFPLEVTKHAES